MLSTHSSISRQAINLPGVWTDGDGLLWHRYKIKSISK